jgi:isoleucyl-tRNA synthetase
MSFKDVPAKVDFPAQELEVQKFWKETRAFEKMKALHKGKPNWSFIDGPITANNPMGVHHGWGRTYKDLFLRYWTMRGRELRYQNGFDCQGLWVEVEVEKELGFKSKKDIEDYGLERFVRKCKERVLRYAAVMTEQSQRLGYWMDWDDPDNLRYLADKLVEDPLQMITYQGVDGTVTDTVEQVIGQLGLAELGGSYYTFSNENNYMIWTFLKKCWENGWVYRGADVMPWCPRCATAISQHEIVTDGYLELTHPGVTLRFPLINREGAALLVWTTTPWTLTSNVAAAVGPELDYVKVTNEDNLIYLSKGTLHMLRGSYEVLEEIKGVDMEGWTYTGPFDDLPAAQTAGGHTELEELQGRSQESAVQAHRVILWDEVGETEGTGIVHIAPGCGAEDFVLSEEFGLPLLAPINEEGYFVEGFGWLSGMHVSEITEPIFEDLQRKGLLYHVEGYTHRYPVCWRCGTELVFRLVDEWFISMGEVYDKPRENLTEEEKSRSLRYQIMDVVDQIRWIPEFGHAREMDWLRNMHDWMISKKRYWGLALPIWECEACNHYEVIGDEVELKARAVAGWEGLEGRTPHRPFIDAVILACTECEGEMRRIPDVGNPWLDAGIVAFSTLRYREDPNYWEKWYPAHWISESFPGQFRNWFYSLLAMSTVMTNQPPFLENFGYASLLAEDGREMHKSWGNAIEFNEAADRMGVDVMRWLYCAHKPENNLLFGFTRGDEVRRNFLIPLWNVYNFFITYANLDGWAPTQENGYALFDPAHPEGATPQTANLLDLWILGRINEVVDKCTVALDNSDAYRATQVVDGFLDDFTNWYVRRSRRRFWKSEQDDDKRAAYGTLYHVLVKLLKTLAPITPFFTEVMYQNLVTAVRPEAYESVHHCAWPEVDQRSIDPDLLSDMNFTRRVASLGLSARSSVGIKLRQPLAQVLVHTGESAPELPEALIRILTDELNVKQLTIVTQATDLITYQLLPDNKVLGPKYGSLLPKIRAALNTADPVVVVGRVEAELSVQLEVEGEVIELAPQEILIRTQPAAGLAVAADRGVTVAVETEITPELHREGLAREIVRRVQAMRKSADFNIEDRITTFYHADADLSEVLVTWEAYIKAETLSTQLVSQEPPEGVFREAHKVGDAEIVLGVQQNP